MHIGVYQGPVKLCLERRVNEKLSLTLNCNGGTQRYEGAKTREWGGGGGAVGRGVFV